MSIDSIMALADRYANDPTWRTREAALRQRTALASAISEAIDKARCSEQLETVGYVDDYGNFEPKFMQWMAEERQRGVTWRTCFAERLGAAA